MSLVSVDGVGEEESPLSSSVKSSGISVIVLRLCTVRSGAWEGGLEIKKKKVRRLHGCLMVEKKLR